MFLHIFPVFRFINIEIVGIIEEIGDLGPTGTIIAS